MAQQPQKNTGSGGRGPAEYGNSIFHCNPAKQPSASSGGFVKGDDTFEKIHILSSLVLPLTKPERKLPLLNQDDNENVLNLFEKNVQTIGG